MYLSGSETTNNVSSYEKIKEKRKRIKDFDKYKNMYTC